VGGERHREAKLFCPRTQHMSPARVPEGGTGSSVLLGIFGGDVPPASLNPDPISEQNTPFPIPVFRPGLKNPYPFSDLTFYLIKHSIASPQFLLLPLYLYSFLSYCP